MISLWKLVMANWHKSQYTTKAPIIKESVPQQLPAPTPSNYNSSQSRQCWYQFSPFPLPQPPQ